MVIFHSYVNVYQRVTMILQACCTFIKDGLLLRRAQNTSWGRGRNGNLSDTFIQCRSDVMGYIYIFIYTSKHINLYIDLFINKYIYMPSGYLTWPWYRWPIEIDGLPIKNGGSFHGYVSHNQRVYIYSKYVLYIYTQHSYIIYQDECHFNEMLIHLGISWYLIESPTVFPRFFVFWFRSSW
jgi:hypothetical protein